MSDRIPDHVKQQAYDVMGATRANIEALEQSGHTNPAMHGQASQQISHQLELPERDPHSREAMQQHAYDVMGAARDNMAQVEKYGHTNMSVQGYLSAHTAENIEATTSRGYEDLSMQQQDVNRDSMDMSRG